MTVLDSVTAVAEEIGLPAPDSLISAGTVSIVAANRQMLRVANTAIRRIVDPYPWSALIVDYPFNFVNGTQYYTAPDDYGKSLNQTAWDTSLRRPLSGPINPQDWQFFKQYGVSGGVYPRFRIKGKTLQIDPVPTTTDAATISYISRFGVVLATPTAFTNARIFFDDADGVFCDENLFELEFKWRLLRAKGLDYVEEMTDAQLATFEAWNADGSKAILDMGDRDLAEIPNTIPGIIAGPYP